MKTNFYCNIKNKIKNTNYNFAKNFLYHLIAPLFILILGITFALCFNFNLGLDFKGGSLTTVVINEDISVNTNYENAKSEIDNILNKYDVKGLVYQKVETNYYGNAITVKFEKVSDEVQQLIKADLIDQFHSVREVDIDNYVKVNNFDANVDTGIITSSALAIIIAVVVAMIYISFRHGISAGFVTLFASAFDLAMLICLLAITRVNLEFSFLAGIAFTSVYSILNSLMLFTTVNDNIKKEKYAKATNFEVANASVKQNLIKNTLFTLFVLMFALLLGAIPTFAVRSISLPVMLGCVVVYLSNMFITPGIWARTYIRRKNKATKQEKQVVVEEKLTEEDITKAPEVIVETEAK